MLRYEIRAGFAACLLVQLVAVGCADSTAPSLQELRFDSVGPVRMLVQQTTSLRVNGFAASGAPLNVRPRWFSSDNRIAVVDSAGRVTAVGVGEVLITAVANNTGASIQVITRPATLELRIPEINNAADSGASYVAEAVFRDALGREISVPWDLTWTLIADPGVARLEFPLAPGNRSVTLFTTNLGNVRLIVSAMGMAHERRFAVFRRDGPPFYVVSFELHQRSSALGWLYVPDLFVGSSETGVHVTRIDFDDAPRPASACGNARLLPMERIPLFDFQPYNFSFTGPPVADGTRVRAVITVEYRGREHQVIGAGKVRTIPDFTITDHGTNGFPWSSC